jgi:hypothetical protein
MAEMADPIAVHIRFNSDPEDLLDRFEQARRRWIEAQERDYDRPLFYASCTTDDGGAIVNVCQTAAAHRAFGQRLHAHIDAVGLSPPDQIERMRVTKLGWDSRSALLANLGTDALRLVSREGRRLQRAGSQCRRGGVRSGQRPSRGVAFALMPASKRQPTRRRLRELLRPGFAAAQPAPAWPSRAARQSCPAAGARRSRRCRVGG